MSAAVGIGLLIGACGGGAAGWVYAVMMNLGNRFPDSLGRRGEDFNVPLMTTGFAVAGAFAGAALSYGALRLSTPNVNLEQGKAELIAHDADCNVTLHNGTKLEMGMNESGHKVCVITKAP